MMARGAHNEPLYDYRVMVDEDRARRGLKPIDRKPGNYLAPKSVAAVRAAERAGGYRPHERGPDPDNYIDDKQLAMVNRYRASRGEGMLQKPNAPQTRNERAGWGLLKALVDHQAMGKAKKTGGGADTTRKREQKARDENKDAAIKAGKRRRGGASIITEGLG